MARNLKMKARGNQKSNEANQIKSSPHDTETHQKVVQNQPKIDGHRGSDWSWGPLGEAWGPFSSQGRPAQKKKATRPKNDHVWAPILSSIFSMCLYFSMFFCILFLVTILMATKTDFSWILISFLDHV